MQLRDHPRMVYKGRPIWPPHWSWIDGPNKSASAEGEDGTLRNAQLSHVLRNTIFLTMTTPDGDRFVGSLSFDDEPAADLFFRVFRNHLDHSVQDIAAIDIV